MAHTYIIETIDTQHRTAPVTTETKSISEARRTVFEAIALRKEVSARRYDENGSTYAVVASAWLSASGEYKTSIDASLIVDAVCTLNRHE